ncbi:hypothetical protein QA639_35730 [Bradyrhizobium pachyrhizi]|uniref:hypothetical protein n=1 Tax=Bradyrhizobium pachyrhizi TaxID=280333 RepID=UPI0024B16BA7|nr:hypothetical protein [Bradyrhizobium pachyrhizi]WFU54862.1 hypothetical protein QA639_35730 [Bradyrhizobium pachyrhizi]
MDAFDRFWQWANKPLESPLTLPAELHQAAARRPRTCGLSSARLVPKVRYGPRDEQILFAKI